MHVTIDLSSRRVNWERRCAETVGPAPRKRTRVTWPLRHEHGADHDAANEWG
jgi:hypothetical protein